jgi:diadenosine tetraphosphate (Ap4A) HIT family hydrolase
MEQACELCNAAGGEVLWKDDFCRVVLVEDADYPGLCRVILEQHVKEMTDLPPGERARLMGVVFAVEAAVREASVPDKINLASLGNAVPHLHWHVIPRWRDDRNFPQPIWAEAARDASRRARPDPASLARRVERRLNEE